MLITLAAVLAPVMAVARQKPLRLWYTKPAAQWEGSLPLGNGRRQPLDRSMNLPGADGLGLGHEARLCRPGIAMGRIF